MTGKLSIAVVLFFVYLDTISGQTVEDQAIPDELKNMSRKIVCIKNANGEFLYTGDNLVKGIRQVYSTLNITTLKGAIQWELIFYRGAAYFRSKKYDKYLYEGIDDDSPLNFIHTPIAFQINFNASFCNRKYDANVSTFYRGYAGFYFERSADTASGEPMYAIITKHTNYYLFPFGTESLRDTNFGVYSGRTIVMLKREPDVIFPKYSAWSIGNCPRNV